MPNDPHAPGSSSVPTKFHTQVAPDESTFTAITKALASVKGVDPTDETILTDIVDQDALDTLVDQTSGSQDDGDIIVRFSVDGFQVRVEYTGRITITEAEEGYK